MDIKLIVGLGNPGSEYENTYHNVGLSFVLEMMREQGAVATYHGKHVSLYKAGGLFFGVPSCYMNTSGLAVKEALRIARVPVSKLLIIHDDSDLGLGSFKVSYDREFAGLESRKDGFDPFVPRRHKGVESIFATLKTREFARGRVGIRPLRRGAPQGAKAADFVLKRISPAQGKKLHGVLKELEVTTKLSENAAVPSG